MVCILRSELSAVPRPWLGIVIVTADRRHAAFRPGPGGSCLSAAIAAVNDQAPEWALAVEGSVGPFDHFPIPVLEAPPNSGIAGCLLAGLEWTASRAAEAAWLLSTAGDDPTPAPDLGRRLSAAVSGGKADMACLESDPAVGLWPVDGRRRLRGLLARSGSDSLDRWMKAGRAATVRPPPAA